MQNKSTMHSETSGQVTRRIFNRPTPGLPQKMTQRKPRAGTKERLMSPDNSVCDSRTGYLNNIKMTPMFSPPHHKTFDINDKTDSTCKYYFYHMIIFNIAL